MRFSFVMAMAALSAAACGPIDEPAEELLGSESDAIVNGALDTTHQAVVAYLTNSKCSATIIDVVGNQGYALTAAHCINNNMGTLRQGNNHANGQFDVQYSVVDAEIHPLYNESGLYDFAMLRFSGANGSTPTMPPLSAALDNIVQNTPMDLVGYGLTENGNTTLRHHLARPIAFETAMRLNFNQQPGGMCSGDSGGAAIHITGGTEYVGGVNAFVSGDCTTSGTALRVSAVRDTFIMPYINGTPYLPQTCDQCTDAHIFDGACTQDVQACFNNGECAAYVNCIQNCATQSCVVQCGAQHPSGQAMYQQIFSCLCEGPCASECATDPQCAAPPTCGLQSGNAACQSCFEGACCGEATACSADAVCVDCLGDVAPGPECQSNAALQSLTACLGDNCASECNIGSGSGGSGAGGGGEGGAGPGATAVSVGATGTGGGAGEDDGGGSLVIDNGCGCALAGAQPRPRWWLLALLPLAVSLRRRRLRPS